MSLTVTEANAVNTVLEVAFGAPHGVRHPAPDAERFADAVETLARASHKTLMAGWSADAARTRALADHARLAGSLRRRPKT